MRLHGTGARRSPRRLRWAWRALKRQFLPILGVAALVWGAGGIVAALNGLSTENAGAWGAFGLLMGVLIGVAHEIERGVIHSVDSLERASRRRVTSATPQISPRALRTLSPDMRTPLGCAVYQPASDYAVALRHLLSTLTMRK